MFKIFSVYIKMIKKYIYYINSNYIFLLYLYQILISNIFILLKNTTYNKIYIIKKNYKNKYLNNYIKNKYLNNFIKSIIKLLIPVVYNKLFP
jgi:hypothetical protein